jgi:hypothetical protein
MDATYQVTPEMLGLTWQRMLPRVLIAGILGSSGGFLLSFLLHGRLSIGSVVGLVVGVLIPTLLQRPLSRTKLRLTDDTIEELDGPVINKDGIARVNEYSDANCPGIEIIGAGKPGWLRKYRIFVPAALPEYQQVRKVVQGWVSAQEWHRV